MSAECSHEVTLYSQATCTPQGPAFNSSGVCQPSGDAPCCGQVLGQAVRLGIRFAEALLRMEGFWREHLAAHPGAVAAFKAVCEHTSKGTRACQAVCQVAKARKDLAITSKARQPCRRLFWPGPMRRRARAGLCMNPGHLHYKGTAACQGSLVSSNECHCVLVVHGAMNATNCRMTCLKRLIQARVPAGDACSAHSRGAAQHDMPCACACTIK